MCVLHQSVLVPVLQLTMTLIEHLPAVCRAGICALPSPWPVSHSHGAGAAREETPAKSWKPSLICDRQKHKPQTPAVGQIPSLAQMRIF